ncbi:hypothetical protein E2C01_080141 [Portunus trituberculatus]|uniref:Uncharacterized protein n=1 Tax=Portunus trituberculatus TaxID=210409 RepID=A0A5B7ILD6_PORTR|nr:hypothetical protein [Portunus trituberculatus]
MEIEARVWVFGVGFRLGVRRW